MDLCARHGRAGPPTPRPQRPRQGVLHPEQRRLGLVLLFEESSSPKRSSIQEWASALSVTDFTESSIVVAGRNGVACVRGKYSITFMHGQMTESITEAGKFLEVWVQQPDDRWLLAVDIWNTDSP